VTNILNETFVETTGAGTFVTMLIMFVDTVGKRVHFISAGHNPPLIVTPSGDSMFLDRGGGPPVGLFSRIPYKREIANVEPGSVVVLYTDGVSEAENAAGEQVGLERLTAVVRNARMNSANEIHSNIRAALDEFVGDAPVHDDSTLIVLKFPS
jgi:phosphoserine phosphatase RsbU/P